MGGCTLIHLRRVRTRTVQRQRGREANQKGGLHYHREGFEYGPERLRQGSVALDVGQHQIGEAPEDL